MNDRSITDVVGLFVFLSTIIFSADAAKVVGPYMAIISTAAIGASFALGRREQSTRLGAVLFFVRVCGLASLISGGIAAMISGMHPSLTERALLAPVAFVLGLVGDDWPALARYLGGKASSWIDMWIKLRSGGGS